MIHHTPNLELQMQELKNQMQTLVNLVTQERAHSPIIPLDVAADEIFQKSSKIVLKWIKDGHLRACAVPDGNRGFYYFFIREQLMEDMEQNFTI